MFAAFRRRAASASRPENSDASNDSSKSNSENHHPPNTGFITPTVTNAPLNTLTVNGNVGMKHRTLSGLSINSSTSSFSTSPTLNITRQQEKQELQTLNDRLAVIIDTVRRLEQDNEKLRNIVKNNAQSFEMETSKVKILYEHELDDAKKLIEELAHEKSRLEIELEKNRSETNEIVAKANRSERDARASESRLKQLEIDLAENKARADAMQLDATRRFEENENLQMINRDLEKQVNALKRQLESETLLRVDLENKNKTLREELQFNQQLFQTKLEQFKEQQRLEMNQTDGLRQQYDARLLQELQQLRTQNEQEIIALREDLAAQYEKKIEDLQMMTRRQTDQIGHYRNELISSRERVEEATKMRDQWNEKVLHAEQRCRELEDRFFRHQQQHEEILIERDEELLHLKQLIDQMQSDYQNLLDSKIGLDREIATYRKLLDAEEERLNIAARVGASPTISDVPEQRTRTKRPRFEVDDQV